MSSYGSSAASSDVSGRSSSASAPPASSASSSSSSGFVKRTRKAAGAGYGAGVKYGKRGAAMVKGSTPIVAKVAKQAGRDAKKKLKKVKDVYISEDFKNFCLHPTIEGVIDHPEYVYVTLAVLTAVAAPERFVLEAALVSALAVGQSELREMSKREFSRRVMQMSPGDVARTAIAIAKVNGGNSSDVSVGSLSSVSGGGGAPPPSKAKGKGKKGKSKAKAKKGKSKAKAKKGKSKDKAKDKKGKDKAKGKKGKKKSKSK